MVKKLLEDREYTVTSTTSITINSEISFKHANLALILVTEDNKVVYNFACDDKRATVVGQTITLVDEEINIDDDLTIIMSFDEGSEMAALNNMDLYLQKVNRNLSLLLEEQLQTNKWLRKIYNPE